jgi:hypothetical protein
VAPAVAAINTSRTRRRVLRVLFKPSPATVSVPPSARPRLEAVRVKALGKETVEDHGHGDVRGYRPSRQSEVLRDVQLKSLN